MKAIRLEELTWQDAKVAIDESQGVAIIPIGSVEQHGYHLPLGTDSFVAQGLAEEAAAKSKALLIPPMWLGWCPHHMALTGSITIRPEVLTEYLYDVMKALKTHGIRKFVLINGHRIVNIVWMQIAAQRAQEDLDVRAVIFDPAYMSKELIAKLGIGPVGHAEEIETSHMIHMHPDLVHMERAVDNPVQDKHLYSVDPNYTKDTLCYVPSRFKDQKAHAAQSGGTAGSPTKATAEIGKEYHEHLVNRLLEVIEQLRGEEL